jgi:choline dehydrogenase-like flavoprotein
MGDGQYAVLNEAGTVEGLANVPIADASIFPDIPRATTAFPAVLVAEHVAEMAFGPVSAIPEHKQAQPVSSRPGDSAPIDQTFPPGAYEQG